MAVLSSVLSAKLSYALLGGGSGSAVLMLLLCVVVGAVLGLLSGLLYVTLRIPPIITSLGVTLIYEGLTFTVTEGKYVNTEVRNASMSAFSGTWIWSALVIVLVLALVWFLFDRTKFGYDYKALQNGQKVAVNTGIREVPNALVCYGICGALMGIVGFLSAVRSSTINGGALPMFIGGYIGRFSNDKLGYLIAALCMSLLNTTFAAFSNEISASMQSIINALLLVIFLIYLSNEGLLKAIFHRRKSA